MNVFALNGSVELWSRTAFMSLSYKVVFHTYDCYIFTKDYMHLFRQVIAAPHSKTKRHGKNIEFQSQS